MSNMKRMTYEDLYFYCKNKNPNEEVVICENIGFDPILGFTRILQKGLFYDKEYDFIYTEQVPIK